MHLPKYRPETWVLFYLRNLIGMGRIVGARIPNCEDSEKWLYTVDMGEMPDDGRYSDIAEEDVFGILHGAGWKKVEVETGES